jgi:8-oxo-dGTP pyrophosphatase MutT (NUDIX family)
MSDFTRRSARVLLLDGADRLLLVKSALPPHIPGGYAWFTPGGGLEEGENLSAAAARELQEETGLSANPADLRLVAYTEGTADLGWASGLFRDDFFYYRVASHEVSVADLMDYERLLYGGHRWWTQSELASTDEIVYPFGLASLMADLVAGKVLGAPVALPWHH